ncbi:MAG TPA: hypothetical protein VFB27_10630, partial [Opitutaceae bacterium]|nr:hypothetical protein [Opitutaceae bacterium]
ALPRRRTWVRPMLLLGVTIIAAMLTAWWLPWQNLSPFGQSALLLLNSPVLLPWVVIAAVVSLLVGAMAALQWDD